MSAATPPDLTPRIAAECELSEGSVEAIVHLLDEGCTVPFIARYRKEATAGAGDAVIHRVMERLGFHRELHERLQTILASIEEQGKLTPELRAALEAAQTRTRLEDLYLPYRPKRRTRATMAREKGLEPLADRMAEQRDTQGAVQEIAREFVDISRGVETVEEALAGARDILAERFTETPEWRASLRGLTWREGRVISKAARGKANEQSKFTDYYDYSEPVRRIPGHRVLAIRRGEREGFLSQRILPDPERAKSWLRRQVVQQPHSIWADQLRLAAEDAYDRLLSAHIETDLRLELKQRADREAIEVFAENLRALLMAAPFGGRPVLAIDPGFRTGCKVVVLSATGRLLGHGLVHPTPPRNDVAGTERALERWFSEYPELVAVVVGNGTGGRETFDVVRRWICKRGLGAQAVMVSEAGASVYSASELAREELPDQDVTVRGAVSIGRRLQDPLAELVKIDPKSIGVGQYQHDVDQKPLKQKLDDVVIACVNAVGVELNTASPSLLQYVSGLSPRLAKAVIARRDEKGSFASRSELLEVSGLGPKTFEQAAGFLRVRGPHPLDDSAVHPERYALVERMAADLGRDVAALVGDAEAAAAIDLERYADDSVGLYTLRDIRDELIKPGRDPREEFETVDFRDDVHAMEDLQEGMVLSGVVTNVTHFGAFVDVGVHQDGLVHVSQIADRFVENPADVLRVGQTVRVRVLDVDLERRRIGLSIRQAQ